MINTHRTVVSIKMGFVVESTKNQIEHSSLFRLLGGKIRSVQLSSTGFHNLDLSDGSARLSNRAVLDSLHNVHAFDDFAEHNMFAVQPGCLDGCDEELRAVRVSSRIGHGYPASSVVLEDKILILELIAVNRFTTSSVSSGEISTLEHKLIDNPMEFGALISEAWGALGQLDKVVHRFGHDVAKESDFDLAGRFTPNGDVEGHLVGHQDPAVIVGLRHDLERQERKEEAENGNAEKDLHGDFGDRVGNTTT